MHFDLWFENPQDHLIRITTTLPATGTQPARLSLSRWRPGRYEPAPYAENICDFRAYTSAGPLPVSKTDTHTWEIAPSGPAPITLEYKYYAIVKDAGGSCFDDEQVYINGINLFLYGPGDLEQPHSFTLHLPADWRVGCGLPSEGMTFRARTWHDLTDAPLLASPTLFHHAFAVDSIPFHIWIQGRARIQPEEIEKHFRAFAQKQIALFGSFPVQDYHFLFQVHDGFFYHGVEHHNSTIIAIGPGLDFMEGETWEEVLGVSSHELFHTWNVKALRPADMLPYAYDRLQYSRLHYITEGITTYYGDLMLLRSGSFSLAEYLSVFNDSILKKWTANAGGAHISLEEASFDSWLNGYKPGVPNRKISFYTKGCLVALILDTRLRARTEGRHSLDTVMRMLWERHALQGTGYTRETYQSILEELAGESMAGFLQDYISGTLDLHPALAAAAEYLGLQLMEQRNSPGSTRQAGFLLDNETVTQVWPGSPAWEAGLSKDDVLVAIDGIKSPGALAGKMLSGAEKFSLHIFRGSRLLNLTLHLPAGAPMTAPTLYLRVNPEASPEQVARRQAWSHEA